MDLAARAPKLTDAKKLIDSVETFIFDCDGEPASSHLMVSVHYLEAESILPFRQTSRMKSEA